MNYVNYINKRIIHENTHVYEMTNISYEYFDIITDTNDSKKKILDKIKPGVVIKSLDYYGKINKKHKIHFILEFCNNIYVQFTEDHNFNKYIPHIFIYDNLTIQPTSLNTDIKIINF